MQKNKVLLCLAAAAISMQFAACSGKSGNSTEPTNYYSVSIDGDYTYYPEDNEDVMSLSAITDDFLYEIINRDYKTANPANEYPYYTKAVRASYEAMNRAESQKASLTANELSTVLNQVTISNIEFYTLRGIPSVSVIADYVSTIEHAVPSYLDSLGIKGNTKYKRTVTIVFAQEENEWKVSTYSATARVEVK